MKSIVTNELLAVIKNKIDILFEAIEKEENPDKQIAYMTQAAIGANDPHEGSEIQLVVQIRVKKDYFLEDGDIAIITEPPAENGAPYKTLYDKIKKDR